VVDALTINETSFFRDAHPFEALRTHILPELIEKRRASRTLRIWCAACSSGQEPYSVALTIKEHFPELAGWRVELVGTDLSPTMLDRAREGRYSRLEVNRGLPARLLVKYFEQDGTDYRIDDSVRRMVTFRPHNLASPWPSLPQTDVVFMRNVLIYFGLETKREILTKVKRVLRPDGYLLLGGAETTVHVDDTFTRTPIGRTTFYRPVAC
jgi:chemotaxis protein methyltransferase CheR